jgi:hypothetical protein
MRGVEREPALVAFLLDRIRRDGGGQRDPAAESLRHGHDVGGDAKVRCREPVAEAPECGLRLVEDEEHPALLGFFAKFLKVAFGRDDHAARADDGFGDDGGARTRRLHVVQLETDLHAGAIALVATVPHRAAVGVRLGNHERAGHSGAVPFAVAGERYRPCVAGDAMPRSPEGDHLEAAAVELGHLDGSVVALASGVHEERLRKRLGEDLRERLRQVDHAPRNHSGEEMQRRLAALADRGDDVRVVVPDRGAHLAGGEVEDAMLPSASQT